MERDAEYLRRRADQERDLATKAAHPQARAAHLELASRFDEFAAAVVKRDRHLGIDLAEAEYIFD
jgi:hypothetical protein